MVTVFFKAKPSFLGSLEFNNNVPPRLAPYWVAFGPLIISILAISCVLKISIAVSPTPLVMGNPLK